MSLVSRRKHTACREERGRRVMRGIDKREKMRRPFLNSPPKSEKDEVKGRLGPKANCQLEPYSQIFLEKSRAGARGQKRASQGGPPSKNFFLKMCQISSLT